MEDYNERIYSLLEKFEKGEANHQELEELDAWYNSFQQNVQYTDGLTGFQESVIKANMFERVQLGIKKQSAPMGKVVRLWPRFASAAIILLIAGAGVMFFLDRQVTQNVFQKSEKIENANDIKPGGNKAVLTLGDGRAIDLRGNKKGVVIDAAELTYNDGTPVTADREMSIQTLTMHTPKGGQYEATLPDGTHVWLNAASTLKFPSRFEGGERLVELSGEAYFEVAHNRSKPFFVISDGQKVEVLGTHFNINSYSDEPGIRTTLLEGAVRIVAKGNVEFLIPGEQAFVGKSRIFKSKVNTNAAVDWKNGYFNFIDTELAEVLRQVSRWYDVEIQYQGEVPAMTFTGYINRNYSLSEVLVILKYMKIDFKIKNRVILVSK